jgi:hypothetical protein
MLTGAGLDSFGQYPGLLGSADPVRLCMESMLGAYSAHV